MNWKRIKDNCPKAFTKLNKWYGVGLLIFHQNYPKRLGHYYTDGVHTVQMWHDFDVRDLYDFFDSENLFVVIWKDHNSKKFGFGINTSTGTLDLDTKKYSERKRAEETGFAKAFELLEKILSNKQK